MTPSSLVSFRVPNGKDYGISDHSTSAKYRPSVKSDCYELAPRLCAKDAYEVLSSDGLSPLDALLMSLERSYECNTILRNGEPMGMFGVAYGGDTISGIPWMLTDGDFQGFRKRFLKEGRQWIGGLKKRHQILFNYVHQENEDSIKWLKWLGFKFMRAIPKYGFGKSDTFYEFYLVSDQCVVQGEPTQP
jgi:hypothetical protein